MTRLCIGELMRKENRKAVYILVVCILGAIIVYCIPYVFKIFSILYT